MTLLYPILAATVLFACAAKPADDAAERASRTPATAAAADVDWDGKGTSVDLANVNGSVTVTTSKGKKIRIRAHKSGPDANDVKVVIKQRGDRVSVHTDYPERGHVEAEVDYEVELPAGVEFDADVVNGSVDVTGVAAPLRLNSVNGTIKAAGARDVSASTVNGRVTVGLSGRATRAQLNAVNGKLEVKLPAKLGAKVRASTLSGSIDSDVPLTRKREMVGAKASGTVGDGAATITLETVSGRIKIATG